MAQVRDLISTASLFGWNLSRGWDVAGPVACDLQWVDRLFPWQLPPQGFVEWGSPDADNERRFVERPIPQSPVSEIAARVDLKLRPPTSR